MNHSFDVEIAKRFGILEAVILNHFAFWIAKNEANGRHYHDGTYWTYNSAAALQQLFPYASKRQIERAVKHLRDEGVIKTGNYNENRYDHTLWYAFTESGASMLQYGNTDITKNVHRYDRMVTPIPDIEPDVYNTDIEPDSIGQIDYESFKNIFNDTCEALTPCKMITDKRKIAIRTFLKDFTTGQWREVCEMANRSAFLSGKNDRNWKAGIDFLLKPDKAAKVIEGGYESEERNESERHRPSCVPKDWKPHNALDDFD